MGEIGKHDDVPAVVRGRGCWLVDQRGKEYFDLSMGYGAVWLGHNNLAVSEAIVAQLDLYAAPGFFPTQAFQAAERAITNLIPDTHFLGGIYSTGMEAIETALRAARVHTGRSGMAGFAGSTYGKSQITSALGAAQEGTHPEFTFRLPSFAGTPREIEVALDRLGRSGQLAAIIVEPIQMTGGGHEINEDTCRQLFAMAASRSFSVIFDETLTGLYRCGRRFYFDSLGASPDVFIIGKGMANGFPAAAVILRKGYAWDRARVKPGSTFWNHPLACAAIAATLGQISETTVLDKVVRIEAAIRKELGKLELRGRGAMWCLGFPARDKQAQFARSLLQSGIVVSYYDGYIRLLPGLEVELGALADACATIKKIYAATFR
jgi:acetylornithine aminotransferase